MSGPICQSKSGLALHAVRRFLEKADARCSALREVIETAHPVARSRAEQKANKTASEYEAARTELLSFIARVEQQS